MAAMKLGLLSLHPAILPGSAQLTSSTLNSISHLMLSLDMSCPAVARFKIQQ